ncbi:MAG TPA: hypothetical protein DCY94_04305 [Firmicutes bacterium]|nr:hypothetical protein [Bacillota bacterium]
MVFFESLTDSQNIYNFIIRPVREYLNEHKKIKDLEPILAGPKLEKLKKIDDVFYYLENGFVVVIYKDDIFTSEIKADIDRGITMSQTEPNMYGPKDAFCENYQKNLGIIKKRIKNKNLKIESVDRGVYTKTKLSILYLDDKVHKVELDKIKETLNRQKDKEVTDSYDLVKELETSKIFPTIFKTEKPALVAKFILKGYVVIIIDNTPFALVMDAKFKDFVNPFTTDKFVRVLRYICLIMNVLIPAIYIALINFNQEAVPTSLLISFSKQRSGVPFPAIIEATAMLFICEILKEADVRFPSTYGSSASILGALVLGDAAVSAGIVSPIMIIVVALSFITGLIFTEMELVGALRLFRYVFLFIAAFLGLYGLSIAIVTSIALLANTKTYEGSYL